MASAKCDAEPDQPAAIFDGALQNGGLRLVDHCDLPGSNGAASADVLSARCCGQELDHVLKAANRAMTGVPTCPTSGLRRNQIGAPPRGNALYGRPPSARLAQIRRISERAEWPELSRSVTAWALGLRPRGATATTDCLHERCRSRRTSYPQSQARIHRAALHCPTWCGGRGDRQMRLIVIVAAKDAPSRERAGLLGAPLPVRA